MERATGRRRPVTRSGLRRKRRRRQAGFAAVALALAAASCQGRGASFDLLLARIDADPLSADPAPFLGAARLAEGTEDILRLLKRASARSPGLAAAVADALGEARGKAGPLPEAAAFAACSAYLDAGRPDAALALFGAALDPAARPALFAEAYAACRARGIAVAARVQDLVAAADATGLPAFLAEAALVAMIDGDAPAAAALLSEAVARGYDAEARLLWDAGATEAILAFRDRDPAPETLHVAADAARALGDGSLACALYLELTENHPDYSWKPYAALSRLPWPAEPPADPQAPPLGEGWPRSAGTASASADPAGYWLELAAARFPGDRGAALELASAQLARGMPERARSLLSGLEPGPDLASLSLALALLDSPDTALPRALELVAEYPESALAREAALGALFSLGAWDTFLSVHDAPGASLPEGWFWDAAALALRGAAAAAADLVRSASGSGRAYAAPMALGVYEMAAGRQREAALAFQTAAGECAARPDPAADAASALTLAGDAWRLAGEPGAARDAYRAALNASPMALGAASGLLLVGGN